MLVAFDNKKIYENKSRPAANKYTANCTKTILIVAGKQPE